MTERNTVARMMHDLGLAAWFGGSLMGAIGVNGAANDVSDPTDRARVAAAGWARWTPVNMAAIASHLAGGALLTLANRRRLAYQKGVPGMTGAKAGLTGLALALTAYSRAKGRQVEQAGRTPVEGSTEPAEETPQQVARAQQRLRALQWAIPAVTGAIEVMNSYAGEQQRPSQQMRGMLARAGQVLRMRAAT
ncbi:hypothetical protein TH66_08780 [Carbonactinospora thermoautotrophica]|uniref:Uncharacterized protein n=1 Tax=Carbonactinospora thermoautotrophica TaxID=1469144 RepID=A0A132NHK6_9ACTN|nr:hypothetical protein [Carbonactinospora thermoautotrophica]KWW99580.1 hypothetical protein LI90_1216 [Carbonactinospora thermoautotrophica]KWX04034.1 hypothetical protein TH66_08780 [Carbonactinospora thermoautotrophica]KWX09192.1 hypothetical protein TR74_11080 [Carbonactinospora thermoautotrophica]